MSLSKAAVKHVDQPIWDRQAALAIVGGDEALARRLVEDLTAKLPEDLDRMRSLAGLGQLDALAEKVHKVRGGAAYCGVPALCAALTELDGSARRCDPDAAATALVRVEEEIARLTAFLWA